MNAHRRPARWVAPLIGGVAMLAAVIAVVFWARHMLAQKSDGPTRSVPQVVQLIRPPPPPVTPPPPPPPEAKVEQPLPKDDPEPAPDNAPEQLGVDAAGTAGGDAFGLAARKGGADLLGTGSAIFGRYTALIKDAILDKLSEDDRIRRGSHSVVVRVWLASDGRVERVALAQSSGKSELDTSIERALSKLSRLSEGPPVEMPQPVTLKIVSRG
jgi:periplasmic protein TonB